MRAYQDSLRKMIAMADSFDTTWPSHESYPLTPDIIPGLLKGAQDLAAGAGTAPPHAVPEVRL